MIEFLIFYIVYSIVMVTWYIAVRGLQQEVDFKELNAGCTYSNLTVVAITTKKISLYVLSIGPAILYKLLQLLLIKDPNDRI